MAFRKTAYVEHLLKKPVSPLMMGLNKCTANNQIINLGTAENHTIDHLLVPLLQNRPEFKASDLSYCAACHTEKLREAIAQLYEDHMGMKNVNSKQILFGSGIAHILERMACALCEKGDLVLIPKPCFGCFEPDMYPSGCSFEYIDLEKLPPSPPENARILILTNPGNPVGEIIPNQSEILRWAYKNPQLHVVLDDIYALTLREGQFTSIMAHPDVDHTRTHHLYGISKDWGMAGFHIGMFYTECKEVFDMVKLCMGCYSMGSDTRQILERIFCDISTRDRLIQESKNGLRMHQAIAENLLQEGGIKFKHVEGSLFIMIDLTDIAPDKEAEKNLWLDLVDNHFIHILPGMNGFRYPIPGWFRLCFSVEEQKLINGCKALIDGVRHIRAKNNSL